MYKIYKLTLPNEKVYIGQTSQEHLYRRCGYGSGYVFNKELYNDIVEYGWKNVEQEILEEVETKEEAIKRERHYILEYNSNNPEFGYNSHENLPKGRKSYIVCVETGQRFESQAEAARFINRTRQAVSYAVVKGTPCAGFHWEKKFVDKS